MNANDIIVSPVISEKTTELMEQNKYVFRVSIKANKQMVNKAIKELFKVTPEKVNIINVRGKRKRVKYQYGNTAAWKKAIVTLSATEKIEIFEGQ